MTMLISVFQRHSGRSLKTFRWLKVHEHVLKNGVEPPIHSGMYKMYLPVTFRSNIFALANMDFEGLFQDYRNTKITTLKLIISDTGIRLSVSLTF